MRLGINALFNARGGALTRLRQLLGTWSRTDQAVANHIHVFCSKHTFPLLREYGGPTISIVELHTPLSHLGSRVLTEQWVLPRELERHKIEVLFCPANTVPFFTSVPRVLYLQNILPFSERLFSPGFSWYFRARCWMLGQSIRLAVKNADRVIVNSYYFRSCLSRLRVVDVSKADVVYSAADPRYNLQSASATAPTHTPYWLCVSGFYPYKNILQLVRAYDEFQKSVGGASPRLVLLGESHFGGYANSIRREIAALKLEALCTISDSLLPHAETLELMRQSDGFLFPSTCEACPTVLVEALRLGVSIASSKLGVMPEICGDAAIYFNPDDPSDIRRALFELHESGKTDLPFSEASLSRASQFPDSGILAREIFKFLQQSALGDG